MEIAQFILLQHKINRDSICFKIVCVPSEYSDQPANPHSPIRIVSSYFEGNEWSKASSYGQQSLWSDCADAQADLTLCWAQM